MNRAPPEANAVRPWIIGAAVALYFAISCAGAIAGMIFTIALTGELQ